MPVTTDRPAPYAPPTAIIEVLERNRTKGIPNPINGEVLERASISPSLIPRTLQALQTLDLINEDGSHTDVLEGLRRAPEGEYKQRLLQWLDAAYADARQYIDPATDDEVAIRDAFRNYNPFGQQSRMVTLFLGLYERAGAIEKKQPNPRAAPAPRKQASTPRASVTTRMSAPKAKEAASTDKLPMHRVDDLPAALSGLLVGLPTIANGWTKAERDRFVATFNVVLDFCFPADLPPKHDNKSVGEDADR